jgi:hypothetical protein
MQTKSPPALHQQKQRHGLRFGLLAVQAALVVGLGVLIYLVALNVAVARSHRLGLRLLEQHRRL